jgi:cold shock CspA family protein
VATGTITWIDAARGCCFIASELRGGDLYVDQADVDCRSIDLRVGAIVEFEVCTGRRGRLVVTNVVARADEQRTRTPELSQTAAEVAADVWEGEGGALR